VEVAIITPEREMLKYRVQLKFPTTNNEAEYEGILMGLRVEKALEVKNLLLQSDSKLIIEQIKEEYEVKEERMQKYLRLTKRLTQEFDRGGIRADPQKLEHGSIQDHEASIVDGKTNEHGPRNGSSKTPQH